MGYSRDFEKSAANLILPKFGVVVDDGFTESRSGKLGFTLNDMAVSARRVQPGLSRSGILANGDLQS